MNQLAIGVLSALLSTNSPVAVGPLPSESTAPDPAATAEYRVLLEADQAALDDVNGWIADNEAFRRAGGGVAPEALAAKIAGRLKIVRSDYEAFLRKHPGHVEGRIAYGSFLNEINEEEEAARQWDKARLLDPSYPATWNNLANHYGHFGPVATAFPYYEKAIELSPDEPVYYQNLATTVYLFRRDAEKYYGFNEQQVFDRALELYRKALALSNGDFAVANDLAQTYYGIEPFRYEEALSTWKEVLKLAKTEVEQQNVFIHLARIEIKGGRPDVAGDYLKQVTLPQYAALRDRLSRLMESQKEKVSPVKGALDPAQADGLGTASAPDRLEQAVFEDLQGDKLTEPDKRKDQK